MLYYAALFFIIALISLLVIFFGNVLAGFAVVVAKISFFVFLALFIICFVIDFKNRRKKGKS